MLMVGRLISTVGKGVNLQVGSTVSQRREVRHDGVRPEQGWDGAVGQVSFTLSLPAALPTGPVVARDVVIAAAVGRGRLVAAGEVDVREDVGTGVAV